MKMIKKVFILSESIEKYKSQIMMMVQIACMYQSSVYVEVDAKYFNVKSIMRIGELKSGDKFSLKIEGLDEEIAMRNFADFFL